MTSDTDSTEGSIMIEGDQARGFLGWQVLGAGFTGQFVSTSVTFAPFGVFVIPVADEFGLPRGQVGLALSFAFLAMGAMGPFIGLWLDRGWARTMMLMGVTLSGSGLIALSRASEPLLALACFVGPVCLGAALYGLMPSMALVANWFSRRRGLAMGIVVSGATMGSFIAPVASAWLIERVGWRDAVAVLGVFAILIGVPVFYRFVVARPELVGQSPDGDVVEAVGAATDEPSAPVIDTAALVRDPRLWLLSVGFGLVFTSPIVMMFAAVPFAEDLGITAQNAAYFFSAAAPFSLLSKVVFGWLADRIPPRLGIWIVVLVNAATWGLLHFDPQYTAFLAIGALYGVGIGAAGPLHGFVLARCFGPLAFGRAAGIGGLSALPLVAGAPALAGWLYDSTGSYQAVFELEVVLIIVGGLLLSVPRIPKQEPVAG